MVKLSSVLALVLCSSAALGQTVNVIDRQFENGIDGMQSFFFSSQSGNPTPLPVLFSIDYAHDFTGGVTNGRAVMSNIFTPNPDGLGEVYNILSIVEDRGYPFIPQTDNGVLSVTYSMSVKCTDCTVGFIVADDQGGQLLGGTLVNSPNAYQTITGTFVRSDFPSREVNAGEPMYFGFYVDTNRTIGASIDLETASIDNLRVDLEADPNGCVSSIDFVDFFSANLNLEGNASIDQGELVITPDIDGQSGAAWVPQRALVANGFETSFTFNLGNNSGDGFAFVIQNDSPTALSGGGSGLGYGGNGLPGFTNAFVIEFDTFSFGPPFEFAEDHVGVHTAGASEVSSDDSNSISYVELQQDLNDGQDHLAIIRYDRGFFSIYIDDLNEPVLTLTADLESLGQFNDNILTESGCAYIGFTGSTGAAFTRQVIKNWAFSTNLDCQAPSISGFYWTSPMRPGQTFEVNVDNFSGSFPFEWTWFRNGVQLFNDSRISGADTNRMFISDFAATDAGVYTFQVSNACGTTGSQFEVFVICSADFDADGDSGTDADIEAFFACLAGNCCATCLTADFDGDGDAGTDADIESFFRVLAGGPC